MLKILSDLYINGNTNIAANFNSIKIGENNSNYLEIDQNGELRLVGNSSVWDDIVQPATTGRQGSNITPVFDYTDLVALFPANNTSHILYFNIQMPHRWKYGSTIYPHVHIIQESNQQAIFNMDYRWASVGTLFPSIWSTYIIDHYKFEYPGSGQFHQIVTNTSGLTGNYTLSSVLQIKLYRNDNNFSGNCKLISFDIHFESDTLGTFTEYEKY